MLKSAAVPVDPDFILEPSCGDGAILDVLREWVGGRDFGKAEPYLSGIELDSDRAAEAERRGHYGQCGSFYDFAPSPLWPSPWIVGNPPFSEA
jgi:hypothetical protein